MDVPSIEILTTRALQELDAALRGVREPQVAELRSMLLAAPAIAAYGVGREGLVMRAFAMRLYHLGLPVGVVGEMTAGPLGPGGLFVCSAGPGALSTVEALMDVAREAGALVVLFTARPDAPLASKADLVVEVPAQTMAGSHGERSSQPMGSLYEQALWLLLDAVVSQLMALRGQTAAELASRHTNLE